MMTSFRYRRLFPVVTAMQIPGEYIVVLRPKPLKAAEFETLKRGAENPKGQIITLTSWTRKIVRTLIDYRLVISIPVAGEHERANHFYFVTTLGYATVAYNETNDDEEEEP